ncbi:MAG TPA: C40 family peptidase [Micromonosporaceae bacterium]
MAVATLWTSPANVRAFDEPALRVPANVRGWVAGMSEADRAGSDGPALSQLLLGDTVLVEEVVDGWARVVAADQPKPDLDTRGYPGWLPATHLTDRGLDAGPTHVVDATATALRDAPHGDVVLSGVTVGTRLTVVGAAHQGWVPVAVPGSDEPLWAIERDLAPVPSEAPDAGVPLAIAERLIDVPYVWGGLSAYGIDCSGLVHLAWRRAGVVLPRDADDQARATQPVPLGDERPGDLYFFARPGKHVHHVGFVAAPPEPDGTRHLLHACGSVNYRVVREPVQGERAETLVGAHRVTQP